MPPGARRSPGNGAAPTPVHPRNALPRLATTGWVRRGPAAGLVWFEVGKGTDVGHVEVAHVGHVLPDGRVLFEDASFRVGEGTTAALVGPNGAGKTTLIRLIAGDVAPQSGTVSFSGGLGVMRQFVGGIRSGTDDPDSGQPDTGRVTGDSAVRDLLLSVAQPRVREAAARLDAAELVMMERDDEAAQMRYAAALAEWGDAGGYEAEVVWDACCLAALATGYEQCRWRAVGTLSGGEQKRLVLEALLRGPAEVLLLDEPDNYLDVPPASAGSNNSLPPSPRRCSWSATTGSCSRTARGASSPWKTAASGCTVTGSPATTRPARNATSASMSCAAGGTRNTRSSSNWSGCTGRRRPTTMRWPPGSRRRRPGCGALRKRARRSWRHGSRTSG